jgi:hypothetical protein
METTRQITAIIFRDAANGRDSNGSTLHRSCLQKEIATSAIRHGRRKRPRWLVRMSERRDGFGKAAGINFRPACRSLNQIQYRTDSSTFGFGSNIRSPSSLCRNVPDLSV